MQLKSNGVTLTSIITSCIPRKEGIEIENRLLGGQLAVQTIGDPVDFMDLEVIVTESVLGTLNTLSMTKAPLVLELDGATFTGPIRRTPQWQVVRQGTYANRLYRGTFTLIVDEEGVV